MSNAITGNVETVVIVDAFSSGSGLLERFRERGFAVIHIQSSDQISPVMMTTKGATGDEEWLFDGNLDALIERLRGRRPAAVVAGADLGISLTDQLNHWLGLRGNPLQSSPARRDKFAMIEAVHRAGLRAAAHTRSSNEEELLCWVRQHGGYPKVVKPTESCGSDGVVICHNESALLQAIRANLGKDNKMGFKNRVVLIEEYLDGPEFFFDTVSADGVHLATDFGLSRRIELPTGTMIYDTIEFLPFEDPRFTVLRDYYFDVLDALEFRNGPSHGELRLTSNGAVVIEVNPRPAGGGMPVLTGMISDYHPFDAMIDAVTDPNAFHSRVARGIKLHKMARIVMLVCNRKGDTVAPADPEIFRALESYVDMHWYYAEHEKFLEETIDLFTCPGLVNLMHDDPAVLERDEKAVRRLEPEFYARMLGERK